MIFTDTELEAYLDEALPGDDMARVEAAARTDHQLAQRLAAIHAQRDGGCHSLGGIWRRHRLTCPTRSELGSYLLGVLAKEHAAYIAFHMEEAGCRLCQANHDDLKRQQAEQSDTGQRRRRKYFESSAGYLGKR
jgi:anti-sigma factor RsiW